VERLTPADRERLASELPRLVKPYPKLMLPEGMAQAWVNPPENPDDCIFSKMSMNYSADLKTHVEPCVFGGNPDCSQCGCSISSALHWMRDVRIAGPVKVGHMVRGSLAIGSAIKKIRRDQDAVNRWQDGARFVGQKSTLVQIVTHGERETP
jgi:hypothetical protein